MTKRQKEILMMYLMNTRDRLENDVVNLRQQLRYRNVDVVDCLELLLSLERLNIFNEIEKNVRALLNLSADDNK